MRTLTRTIQCPVCDRLAILTLFEHDDPVTQVESQQFTFACTDARHSLTENSMINLWAMHCATG